MHENGRIMADMRHYRTNAIKVKAWIINVTTLWISLVYLPQFCRRNKTWIAHLFEFSPHSIPRPWVIRCFINMVSPDVSVKTGFDWKCCSDKTENTACFTVKSSTNLNVGLLSQMTVQSFCEQLCLISCWYCYYSDFQAEGFLAAGAVSNALCPVWSFLGSRPQKTTTLFLGFE